jgi:phosphoglycerate kinase
MKYIDELELEGKRVFIRVDFNIDRDNKGSIADDTRVHAALPTIQYALDHRAKVILASHLGRPKGEKKENLSLLPVAECLSGLLKKDVIFPEDCVWDAVKKLAYDMREGQVMLLENLRFHKGETDNDETFSRELADIADVYIDDSFGTLHRAHASTSGMVAFVPEKAAGLLVKKELEHLDHILKSPEKPFWAILGGAKVSDKIGVIENLLTRVQGLILGGGLAYTFLKALGHNIGNSRLEDEKLFVAKKVLEKAKEKEIPILLPIDHAIAQSMELGAPFQFTEGADIPDGWIGLDIGPKTIALFQDALEQARTVFWNGPMGYFENKNFIHGSKGIAQVITGPGVNSIVGGGQSVSVLQQLGLANKVTHLSTGGGASLEYIEGCKLPGLVALEN